MKIFHRFKSGNINLFGATIAYRGWKIRPFFRLKVVRIGPTRMYCVGPIAVLVG